MRYEDPKERERHLVAARHLAHEINAPEANVIVAYERELDKLDAVARVKQFLGLLAIKHVKAALAERNRAGGGA